MKNVMVQAALEAIAEKHGGMLLPEHVVETARNPKHPLHSRFTWDDTEAAREWRLVEARNLIRVCVTVIKPGLPETPVWVSLSSDRPEGKGYRMTVDVLSNEAQRAQLLKDALHELTRLQSKYRELTELAAVFAEVRKVKAAKSA